MRLWSCEQRSRNLTQDSHHRIEIARVETFERGVDEVIEKFHANVSLQVLDDLGDDERGETIAPVDVRLETVHPRMLGRLFRVRLGWCSGIGRTHANKFLGANRLESVLSSEE